MKQIVILFVLGIACLFSTAKAQFSQSFDTNGSYAGNCWDFSGFVLTSDPSDVINGTYSLYTNPPTNNNGSGTRDVLTPYLNIASTTFLVSFKYKLSSALNGLATRGIEIGLLDRNGLFTSLDAIGMNNNTSNQTQTNTYSKTFTLASASVQRLAFKFSGSQGDGNTRIIMDDLLTNANAYYTQTSNCNSAPIAADNSQYPQSNTAPYFGASVLNNDSDPNNETLTATLATPSPDGTVVMNADGTFTFTPNAGFTGAFTSFTYTVTDNGYSRLSSTATVSLYFPQVTTLPIQLLHFSGTAAAKIDLSWRVAANETGLFFEVQRSTGDSGFRSIATIFTSEQSGVEQYQFSDATPGQTTRYRLKVVNRDGTVFFSAVVSFQKGEADEKITLLQNPVQGCLRFMLPATVAATSRILIYNTAGAVVYTGKTSIEKGNNQISLPLQSSLPAGTYVLKAATGTSTQTILFVKR